MPEGKLCSRQPTCVNHNVSFAIDLDALDDYNDIRADENGVWKRKGAPIAIVSIHKSKNPAQVARRRKMRSLPHYYKLSRTYYYYYYYYYYYIIIIIVITLQLAAEGLLQDVTA